MARLTKYGLGCVAIAAFSVLIQHVLMRMVPSTMSPAAVIQYMLDMRHTTLGAKWVRRNAPPLEARSLQGKLAFISGGTGGIGFATARYLAAAGAEVHVTGRSRERGETAAAAAASLDGHIIFHPADLSSITGVRTFVETFIARTLRGRHIDILVQNLASMFAEHGQNADGHERTLGTNLLSFYVLAEMLAPHLARHDARMINVVSAGHHLFSLKLEDLETLNAGVARFDGIRAYSLTHRARVLLSERWANSTAFSGVAIASVHPGWVDTTGLREAAPMALFYASMKSLLRDEDEGADTVVWLASPATPLATADLNGGYFWDRQRRAIDLPLAGTAASEDELNRVISWLNKMTK